MPEKMTGKMSSFRLEPRLLSALDQAAVKMTEEHGGGFGPPWTRTDVLRYFIKRGLAELGVSAEKAESPPKKAPAPSKRKAGPPLKKGGRR
jgi:hypothetical protein